MAQYVVVVRALETGFCDRIDPRLEKARQRYERKREVRRHLALIPVHVGNRSAHGIELVVQLHLGIPRFETEERRKSEACADRGICCLHECSGLDHHALEDCRDDIEFRRVGLRRFGGECRTDSTTSDSEQRNLRIRIQLGILQLKCCAHSIQLRVPRELTREDPVGITVSVVPDVGNYYGITFSEHQRQRTQGRPGGTVQRIAAGPV